MAARSVTSPFYTIEETIEVLSDAITFSKTTPDAISRLNKCAELIRDPQLYDRAKIDLVNLLWMTMPAFETTASMKALNERGALIEYVQAWGDPRNGIAEMAKAPGIVGSLEVYSIFHFWSIGVDSGIVLTESKRRTLSLTPTEKSSR